MSDYKPPKIYTDADFLLVMNTIGTLYEDDILNADAPNAYARHITNALNNGNIRREYSHDQASTDPEAEPLSACYKLTDTGKMRVKIIKHERGL